MIKYPLTLFQNINQHNHSQKDNKEVLQTLIQDINIIHDDILEHFPSQNTETITTYLRQEVNNSLFNKLDLFKSILHNLNSIDDIDSKLNYIESLFIQEEEEENISLKSYTNFSITIDNSQDNIPQESNDPDIILEEKIPDEDLESMLELL